MKSFNLVVITALPVFFLFHLNGSVRDGNEQSHTAQFQLGATAMKVHLLISRHGVQERGYLKFCVKANATSTSSAPPAPSLPALFREPGDLLLDLPLIKYARQASSKTFREVQAYIDNNIRGDRLVKIAIAASVLLRAQESAYSQFFRGFEDLAKHDWEHAQKFANEIYVVPGVRPNNPRPNSYPTSVLLEKNPIDQMVTDIQRHTIAPPRSILQSIGRVLNKSTLDQFNRSQQLAGDPDFFIKNVLPSLLAKLLGQELPKQCAEDDGCEIVMALATHAEVMNMNPIGSLCGRHWAFTPENPKKRANEYQVVDLQLNVTYGADETWQVSLADCYNVSIGSPKNDCGHTVQEVTEIVGEQVLEHMIRVYEMWFTDLVQSGSLDKAHTDSVLSYFTTEPSSFHEALGLLGHSKDVSRNAMRSASIRSSVAVLCLCVALCLHNGYLQME